MIPTVFRIRHGLCTVAAALLLMQAAAWADPGIVARGITRPSETAELSFPAMGIIKEVPVKPGDAVKAGDVLLIQDDRMEAMALEILRLESDSLLRTQAAQAELEQKQVELDRIEELAKSRLASPTELQEARLAVKLAGLQLELANQQRAQRALEADRQAVKVELMRLVSPIDGFVEAIDASVGQVVDPSRPSCTVVKIDPLWIEVRQLAHEQVAHLRTGQTIQVRHSDQDWTEARIIFIASRGDAAAGTQLVRLELPNPTGRASGQEVQVRVPVAGEAPHARAVEN